MKASKFIVLVGGILGLIAFFLPMAKGSTKSEAGEVEVSLSAFTVVKGIDKVQDVAKSADIDKMKEGMTDAQKAAFDQGAKEGFDKGKKDLNDTLSEVKMFVMAIFVPALLLSLLGGLAVFKGKFGRGAGALSLILGLIGLGIAALLKAGLEESAAIAITLLLVTGAAGTIGGLLALIKPERGHVHA